MNGKRWNNTFEVLMNLNSDHMEKEERDLIKRNIKLKNERMIQNNKI
jgi:hypothetical protein